MAALLLNRSRQRLRIAIALTASALLHCAAVGFASLHRPEVATSVANGWDDFLPAIDIEVPDETQPPPDIPEPTPAPMPMDDQSLFTETIEPSPPPRPQTLPPSQPVQRTGSGRAAANKSSPSAKALALQAPRPEYPYEARRARITGEGVAILTVDPASGSVLDVTMAQSTGSAVLDQAAIAGFRRWRFQSGTPARVRCPITYTLTGVAF